MKKQDKMIKKIQGYFQQNRYGILISIILAISFFLRFYNYQNRFGLAYDQAHDAIIARYALENLLIPFVGPFSSAGPFQTGGEWYWFLMIGGAMFPELLISFWIFMTLTYVLFVFLIIKVGELIKDKTFGIIAGIFACFSTSQIAQGTNLTNQGPQAILALGAIWAGIRYLRVKTPTYLFLLGLFISFGISIHTQAGAGLVMLPIVFFFVRKFDVKSIFLLLLGLFIPYIPILIFDVQNDFVNIKGVIQYLFFDQNKISMEVLGRRWLTYVFDFWPKAWAHIIGGYQPVGYVILLGLSITSLYQIFRKKADNVFVFLLSSFVGMFIILRYIRTPLFDSYLVFISPFIILLTVYFAYFFWKKRILLGILLTSVIVFFSFHKDIQEINHPGNNLLRTTVERWQSLIFNKFPNEKFSFYDYNLDSRSTSFPLVYYIYFQNKVAGEGRKIGIVKPAKEYSFPYEFLIDTTTGYRLYVLSGSQESLEAEGWFSINPREVYESTQNWKKLSEK